MAKRSAGYSAAPENLRKAACKGFICLLQETDNPDLRDRAYVYWRLLSSDPEAARAVVLAEKPVIAQDTSAMDPRLLQTLLGNLSTLSSVYHLPPSVSSWTESPHTWVCFPCNLPMLTYVYRTAGVQTILTRAVSQSIPQLDN